MSQGLALVIEDDYDASAIFAKALKVLGFETEIISSGSIALERLKAVVPQMIILDLHLPEVVGTDILRAIRADERLADTRVIVATADPRSADLIQDDADIVLIKPTTFSQVRDFAQRLTSQPRKKQPAAPAAAQISDPEAEAPSTQTTASAAPAAPTVQPEAAKPQAPQPEAVKPQAPQAPPTKPEDGASADHAARPDSDQAKAATTPATPAAPTAPPNPENAGPDSTSA